MTALAGGLGPLGRLRAGDLDSPGVLGAAVRAARALAELKGAAGAIPDAGILIDTLVLQEAKDSSAVESIITTHDELFEQGEQLRLFEVAADADQPIGQAAKEVRGYVRGLRIGLERVQKRGVLTSNDLIEVQAELTGSRSGFRRVPGTALRDGHGEMVYEPPQDPARIIALMSDLERFINDDSVFDTDPLVKMALIHHQFESIHPFYDGNGRTGRILNVLYLVKSGLLALPILYLSRHIVRTKGEYYRRLRAIRESADGPEAWQAWVIYMLTGIESIAVQTLGTVNSIRRVYEDYRQRIQCDYSFYSQDLITNLFRNPYTRIAYLERDLDVSRITATKYLDALADAGYLQKQKRGRSNYYTNVALYAILTQPDMVDGESMGR